MHAVIGQLHIIIMTRQDHKQRRLRHRVVINMGEADFMNACACADQAEDRRPSWSRRRQDVTDCRKQALGVQFVNFSKKRKPVGLSAIVERRPKALLAHRSVGNSQHRCLQEKSYIARVWWCGGLFVYLYRQCDSNQAIVITLIIELSALSP